MSPRGTRPGDDRGEARVPGQAETSIHHSAELPLETARLLQAGKLEQTCPACGIREAAGYYCTACERPTGPEDWYHKTASPARRAALAKGRAARSLSSQAKRAAGLEQSAGPEPLA